MNFSEFAHRLFSVMSGSSSAEVFTKTLFIELVNDEGKAIVKEKNISNFKAYFYNKSQITKFARVINLYIDKMGFIEFIDDYGDAVADNLCSKFSDVFQDVSPTNISEKLADCFVEIVTNAAKAKKTANSTKEISKGKDTSQYSETAKTGQEFVKKHLADVIPTITKSDNPFAIYTKKAKEYYSTKKTLLYAEEPRPFYDIYVCNSIKYNNGHIFDSKDPKTRIVLNNVTISSLMPPYDYMIIEGTGGIGKSMLMTHLFLSFEIEKDKASRIPIFIQLKEYSKLNETLTELICNAVKAFNESVLEEDICQSSSDGKLILLLDGLDEIPSKFRQSFNNALENYIKTYPEVNIIMTSRPFYSFASYSKFAVFDILELSKEQSLELVNKLEFWDTKTKEKFLVALEHRLYSSHHQFASNPLLLTIMLMTYASFGEVPAKMHHFYAQAYETMARLHDASKGSYVRPLHTRITPEEFADYFAQFCARTYCDEIIEFTERTFSDYMKKVIKDINSPQCVAQPHDFLLDLTENLCIMYREGEKYYFIHRSFQEYFAALFFSSYYDEKLQKLGHFFESKKHRFESDVAFDMLYDMIPDKVERFVFLPFLEKIVTQLIGDAKDEYWLYILLLYPVIGYEKGYTEESLINGPDSFLYEKIINFKNLKKYNELYELKWPEKIFDWYTTKNWYEVHSYFMDSKAYQEYPDPEKIDASVFNKYKLVEWDDIPDEYMRYFGNPNEEGSSGELEIEELLQHSEDFKEIIEFMENDGFPLMQEYLAVRAYLGELRLKNQKLAESDSLFDD